MSTVVTFVLLFFVVSDFVEWHVFLIRKIKIKNKIQRLKKKKGTAIARNKDVGCHKDHPNQSGSAF